MSKVTAKYQVTIPPEARKGLGIVPGMQIDIRKRGNRLELFVDLVSQLKKKWRGKFKGGQTTDQYLEEIRGGVE
jgi:AbrB family looped-hinge helix DNA binding protein